MENSHCLGIFIILINKKKTRYTPDQTDSFYVNESLSRTSSSTCAYHHETPRYTSEFTSESPKAIVL